MTLLRKALKAVGHLAAVAVLYMAFSGALWLGLQVDVVYGSAASLAVIVLVGLYVRWAFMRK